jgi:hypothetical protein
MEREPPSGRVRASGAGKYQRRPSGKRPRSAEPCSLRAHDRKRTFRRCQAQHSHTLAPTRARRRRSSPANRPAEAEECGSSRLRHDIAKPIRRSEAASARVGAGAWGRLGMRLVSEFFRGTLLLGRVGSARHRRGEHRARPHRPCVLRLSQTASSGGVAGVTRRRRSANRCAEAEERGSSRLRYDIDKPIRRSEAASGRVGAGAWGRPGMRLVSEFF